MPLEKLAHHNGWNYGQSVMLCFLLLGVTMILSLFIALSWLLVASSAALANRVNRLEFAFVFLLANFINTNLYYLMGESFHVFELSKDPQRYVSLSLIQSVIVPLLLAIAIDKLFRTSSTSGKLAILLSAFVLLTGIEALSVSMQIIVFEQYRVLLGLIAYRLVLLVVPLVALRLFRRMCSHS